MIIIKRKINHRIIKDTLIGCFQFSKAALRDCGVKIQFSDFKAKKQTIFTPASQYIAFAKLAILNLNYLRNYRKLTGRYIHGVKITKSGLIAASHLGGSKGVKDWIDKGNDPHDCNGTKISTYLKRFQKYKL